MPPARTPRGKPRGLFAPSPNKWLVRILERTWYLFLPLIGVWIAETRFIEPNVAEIRNAGIIDSLKAASAARRLLNEMNGTESVIRAATFESDSILAPAIARRAFMVDSLRSIARKDTLAVLAVLAAIDSLEGVTLSVEQETAALGDSLLAYEARRAELEEVAVSMADSLARIRLQINETWNQVGAIRDAPTIFQRAAAVRAAAAEARKPQE